MNIVLLHHDDDDDDDDDPLVHLSGMTQFCQSCNQTPAQIYPNSICPENAIVVMIFEIHSRFLSVNRKTDETCIRIEFQEVPLCCKSLNLRSPLNPPMAI